MDQTIHLSVDTKRIVGIVVSLQVKVVTSNELTLIEQIKIGDLVYTHKGRFRKVTKTFKGFHKGNVYSIKTYGDFKV